MRKRLQKALGIGALLAAAMTMTAFADTRITNVRITCGIDEDASIPGEEGGVVSPDFYTDSDQYEIASYSDTSTTSTTYKSPRTYEVVLSANSGYYFPDEDYVSVTGTGITEITRKKTDDEYQMTIRVKAYPYYRWKAPRITTTGDLKDATSIRWDKEGAPKVEYIIEWVDKNGEEQSRTGTSTGTSVSVTAYNKEATEREKEDGKQDSEVTGFAIRGIGNAGDNTRTAPSEWTDRDVDPTNYDFSSFEYWGDLEFSSGGSANSGATGGNHNNGGGAGWQQRGNDWYWRNANGSYATGWIWDGANWYLCDNTGRMQAGWYFDGTNWFYLNTQHDGTYGRMLTGWQNIDGHTFYLNPVSDGTKGAMFVGWRVVDGVNRYFNEAHDGTYGRLIQ